MIFYNEGDDTNYLLKQCILKRNYLNNILDLQKQKKQILLTCMNKISSAINAIVDVDNVSILFNLLDSLKVSLNLSEFNINKITKLEGCLADLQTDISNGATISTTDISLFEMFEDICDDDQDSLSSVIDRFNEKYSSIEKKIMENDTTINAFLLSFADKSTFEIPNSLISQDNNSENSDEFTEII